MHTFVAISLVSALLAASMTACRLFYNFQKHLQATRKTGLNYITAPFPGHSAIWILLNELIGPTLRRIPFSASWRWLDQNDRQDGYHRPMKAHHLYGDTFCSVSPQVIMLTTCNAELITQITQRKSDFLKPIRNYNIINIFGRNIVTQEGEDWRRHKKVVGPSFSEKSNKLVFKESLRQAKSMLEYWSTLEGNSSREMNLANIAHDAATLSLHVICAAGFGLSQRWPGEKEITTSTKSEIIVQSKGHTLTFKEGMNALIYGIKWLALFPPWLLRISPFKTHNFIFRAYCECLQYFEELREAKKAQLHVGEHSVDGTMDLMGPMIKASDDSPENIHSNSQTQKNPILSSSEIIGNSFVFFFAGHETTANSIHFSIIYLATDIAIQQHMQADIDRIVGSKATSTFSYHEDMPRLYNSLVGAVLNEQLRLMPAILQIPKEANGDQVVTIDGREFVIPHMTHIQLSVVATNRNPRYWPHSPSKLTPGTNDLNDFVPGRWLTSSQSPPAARKSEQDPIDDLEQPSFETSSSDSLFKPAKGTFITFSEGWRACPGRRFAQVEVTAVLTGIFQRYSVELDVRDWATDNEVRRMNRSEKRECYGKAVERARVTLKRCEQKVITLQLKHGDKVPIRFVERGSEMFAGVY